MSLNHVVAAMSKKSCTLDWDVVVNYSVEELNKLLDASYQNDRYFRKDLSIKVEAYDENHEPSVVSYDFKLGVPLLNFDLYAATPACSLKIPINGGSIKVNREWIIEPGEFTLLLSGIPLDSINDIDPNPQTTDKAFIFPGDPHSPAIVTLDLITAAPSFTVELQIVDNFSDSSPIVFQKSNIETAVRDFFNNPAQVSSIRLDLAHHWPSLPYIVFIPRSFRFASYVVEGRKTNGVLSIFVQTRKKQYGRQAGLQEAWTKQWKNFKTPPIPTSYTASVIFGNKMMIETMDESLSSNYYMRVKTAPGELLKLKLEHSFFQLPPIDEVRVAERGELQFTIRIIASAESVGLHEDPNILCVTLGQDGDSATMHLDWSFTSSVNWESHSEVTRGLHAVVESSGSINVLNKLSKKKTVGTDTLSHYVLRFDFSVDEVDWQEPTFTGDKTSLWLQILEYANWKPDRFKSHLLVRPGPNVEMDFFSMTNIILPHGRAITFDASSAIHFPGDIYLVGNILKK